MLVIDRRQWQAVSGPLVAHNGCMKTRHEEWQDHLENLSHEQESGH